MSRRYRLHVVFTFLGIVCGYLLLHPYSMLVYALIHSLGGGSAPVSWHDLKLRDIAGFHPAMLPMAVSFSLFGGIIGLLIAVLLERRRMLLAMQHENESRRIAIETLQQVMVTLAHYLLNSNMIIGGKVRHCRKATLDQDILDALKVIEEQGRKIDAVVGSLRKATEVKVAQYTTGGSVKMIDITREIEEQIGKVGQAQ